MRIIICGAGQVGSHTAEVLASTDNNITVIDTDAARLSAIADSLDVATLTGSCSDAEILSEVIIPAGTLGIVTSLWAHHTEITLRQFFEAWIAVTLAVTLFCYALAVETGD